MSGNIQAGSWQRTGEYHTRGVPVLHGQRWQLPLCVEEGIDPKKFYPTSVLQQDGILYVAYSSAGNEESACCAIEAQSGTLRWRFTVTDRSEDLPYCLREAQPDSVPRDISSMVLTATTAFVGTTYGVVYGLDLRTGQPTWKMDVDDLQAHVGEEAFAGFFGEDEFEGVPLTTLVDGCFFVVQAVIDNILLVTAGENVSYASDARGICAIDIAEQTYLWYTPGLADGTLTLWDHMLYGCILLDERWGDRIYCAYDWQRQQFMWHSDCLDGGVSSLEKPDLEESKTLPIEIAMDGYLPLFQKTLYVVGQKKIGGHVQLTALDAETGKIRWTYSSAEFEFGGYHCYVTVANGLVYASQYGERCAIDLETHQLR